MASMAEQVGSSVVCDFQREGREFVADHSMPASAIQAAQHISAAGMDILRSGVDLDARRAVQNRKRRAGDSAARAALGLPAEPLEGTVVVDEQGEKVRAVCDACALCGGGTKPVPLVNQQGLCPERKGVITSAFNGRNYFDDFSKSQQ